MSGVRSCDSLKRPATKTFPPLGVISRTARATIASVTRFAVTVSATEIHETLRESSPSWVNWVSDLHWHYHQPGWQRAPRSSTKRCECFLWLYLGSSVANLDYFNLDVDYFHII